VGTALRRGCLEEAAGGFPWAFAAFAAASALGCFSLLSPLTRRRLRGGGMGMEANALGESASSRANFARVKSP